VSFVVDTDICSAYLRGDGRIFSRFVQYAGGIHLSSITVAELFKWACRAGVSPKRLVSVQQLIDESTVVPLNATLAKRVGETRAALLDRGIVVSIPDLCIAVTAVELNFTIPTHNVAHFKHVPGIRIQDWIATS